MLCDRSIDGEGYANTYLILSKRKLFVVSIQGDVANVESMNIDNIETAFTVNLVASGIIVLKEDEERVIGAFTNREMGSAAKFVSIFTKLKKNEDISDEDVEDRQENTTCPKCGMRFPEEGRPICPKCMKKHAIFFRLLRFAGQYKLLMFFIVLFMLLNSATGLVIPYLQGTVLFDQALGNTGDFAGRIGLVILLIFAFRTISLLFGVLFSMINARLAANVVFDLKKWDESGMKFYLDHELYWELDQSPDYPMVTLLQINDGDGGWIGELDRSIPYPKEFLVDYLRVYKREGMPMELTPLEGKEGNLARFAISGVGNDITWGDLYNAQSHICYINDGDPNTALLSKPEESLPHYIYLDWMEPQAFDTVSLTTRAGLKQGPTQWGIEVSPDGVTDWRKVGESGQVAWSHREDEPETYEITFAQIEQVKSLRVVIQAFNGSQESRSYLIQDIAVYLSAKV